MKVFEVTTVDGNHIRVRAINFRIQDIATHFYGAEAEEVDCFYNRQIIRVRRVID